MARLLHTADWHLGRILHGVHLTDDQRVLLDRLVQVVQEQRPDAVLVAGDVFDRAVPPPDAVRLLDQTLSRIVLDLGVPVVMVAGNHDSPDRLGFGSRILAQRGLVVAGAPSDRVPSLRLHDEHGPLDIHALPYCEPAAVRQVFPDAAVPDHAAAMARMVEHLLAQAPAGVRRVLVGHAFVAGGLVAESERALSVGGAGTVDAASLAAFDFVALGHLHRRQSVGSDRIRYSGSLFKYSFSESEHRKSVDLVTIGAPGEVPAVQAIALEGPRDLRRLDGTIQALLAAPHGPGRDDYISVMLRDPGLVYDAIGKLRAVYPNVLHIERPEFVPAEGTLRGIDRRAMEDGEVFARFFLEVTGESLSEAEATVLKDEMDALARREREGVA